MNNGNGGNVFPGSNTVNSIYNNNNKNVPNRNQRIRRPIRRTPLKRRPQRTTSRASNVRSNTNKIVGHTRIRAQNRPQKNNRIKN